MQFLSCINFRTTSFTVRRFSRLVSNLREPQQSFVIISKCNDIYANLSLEDWLYNNCKLSDAVFGFLMWVNDPCIVIGRHQNPWTECNINDCLMNDIKIVRRNSGGGTVYHDREFISDVLKAKFNIDSEITAREDLVLQNNKRKISGTASKLGAKCAYHHCTLLVDVDISKMRLAIRKNKSECMTSKATESVRSPVENLINRNPSIEMNSLIQSLAEEFCRRNDAQLITDLVETDFDDFDKISSNLQSWEWIYGKTPRFCIDTHYKHANANYNIHISVYHGIIESVNFESPDSCSPELIGKPFRTDIISDELKKWIESTGHADWSVLSSFSLMNAIKSVL